MPLRVRWSDGTAPAGGGTAATVASAEDIARGAARALAAMGFAPLAEFALANGRRADLAAIDRRGLCAIVEVKASRADFLADRKWPDYLPYCDSFYFAVAPDFPLGLLPEATGLIVADRFAGEVVRPAPLRPLAAAARKALLIRFARTGALRLHGALDPEW